MQINLYIYIYVHTCIHLYIHKCRHVCIYIYRWPEASRTMSMPVSCSVRPFAAAALISVVPMNRVRRESSGSANVERSSFISASASSFWMLSRICAPAGVIICTFCTSKASKLSTSGLYGCFACGQWSQHACTSCSPPKHNTQQSTSDGDKVYI